MYKLIICTGHAEKKKGGVEIKKKKMKKYYKTKKNCLHESPILGLAANTAATSRYRCLWLGLDSTELPLPLFLLLRMATSTEADGRRNSSSTASSEGDLEDDVDADDGDDVRRRALARRRLSVDKLTRALAACKTISASSSPGTPPASPFGCDDFRDVTGRPKSCVVAVDVVRMGVVSSTSG